MFSLTSNPSVTLSQSVIPQPSGTQDSDPLTTPSDNSVLLTVIGAVIITVIVVVSLVFLVKKRGFPKSLGLSINGVRINAE
jgi:hypothetical protein